MIRRGGQDHAWCAFLRPGQGRHPRAAPSPVVTIRPRRRSGLRPSRRSPRDHDRDERRRSPAPPPSSPAVLAAVEEDAETSLWPDAPRLKKAASYSGAPVELGTRFTAGEDGWVAGVRFYKPKGAKGSYTGSLWSESGSRLARVSFGRTSPSGWQEARFTTPVRVQAGQTYTVSYHTRGGMFVGSKSTEKTVSGPLSTAPRGAGVYTYRKGAFPDRWNPKNYNYWVDVIFRWRRVTPKPLPTLKPGARRRARPPPRGRIPGGAGARPDRHGASDAHAGPHGHREPHGHHHRHHGSDRDRHLVPDGRSGPDPQRDPDPHGDGDEHPDPDSHTDTDSHADADADGHPVPDGRSGPDPQRDPDPHDHGDGHAQADAHRDLHPHPDPDDRPAPGNGGCPNHPTPTARACRPAPS
nr:hypothetical protein GCM10020093_083460 [Planobispora longispora]